MGEFIDFMASRRAPTEPEEQDAPATTFTDFMADRRPEPVEEAGEALDITGFMESRQPEAPAPSPATDVFSQPELGEDPTKLSVLPEHRVTPEEGDFTIDESPADRLAMFDEAVGDTPEDVAARQADIEKIEARRAAVGPLGALAKGYLSGASVGVARPAIDKLEQATGITMDAPLGAKTKTEERFLMAGNALGTISSALGIAGKIGKMAAPIKSAFAKLLVTRLGTTGVISASNNLVQLASGQKELPKSLEDVGISLGASTVAMIPELLIPAGGATGKVANFSGQVIADLLFDMATDPEFDRSVQEHGGWDGWKQWMASPEQSTRFVTSVAMAGRDAADPDFELTRTEIVSNAKNKILADWESTRPLDTGAPAKEPLVKQEQKIAFGRTKPRETEFGPIGSRGEGGLVKSPTESEVKAALAGEVAKGARISPFGEQAISTGLKADDVTAMLAKQDAGAPKAARRAVKEEEKARTEKAVEEGIFNGKFMARKAVKNDMALEGKPASTASSGEIGVKETDPMDLGTDADLKFSENDKAFAAAIKKNKETLPRALKRLIVDQQATVKDALLKAGAKDAVQQKVLSAGNSSEAERQRKLAYKHVKDVLPAGHERTLAKYIDFKRTVEVSELSADRGVDIKHHGDLKAEEAREWLIEFENQDRTIVDGVKQAADVYWGEMRGQLDQMHKAGLVTDDAYNSLVENHKFYSPRQYIGFIDPGTGVDRGSRAFDSGIKGLGEGSDEAMRTDPFALMTDAMARSQARIFKNKANTELVKFIEDNPDAKMGRVLATDEQAGRNEGTVNAYVNGELTRVAMDKNMAAEWEGLSPALSQDVANWAQWLSGTKPLKFMATGANPEFALANLPRDAAYAWFNSGQYSRFMPTAFAQQVTDYASVAKDAFTRKGQYVDYIKEGGGMDFLTTQGRDLTAPWKSTTKLKGNLAKISDGLAYLGETSEIATKLAVRSRAMQNGQTPEEATFTARNMLDFSQGGRAIKAADNVIPYLNAAVQGTRGTFRTFKTDPAGAIMKASQLATMGYALAHSSRALNEEQWDAISDDTKARKWAIGLPIWKTDADGNKRWGYLEIPKDQGQQVFSAAGQSLADATGGKPWSPQLIKAMGSLMPADMANALPPVYNAYNAYFSNYDSFTEDNVWGKYSDVSADKEYRLTTPQIAKDLSDVAGSMGVDVSPERLARATSKLIPNSNPIPGLLSGLYDMVAGSEDGNATMIETVKKIPALRRILRFTTTTNLTEKQRKDAERLGVKTKGRTKKDINIETGEKKTAIADDRQVLNVELDRFMQGDGVHNSKLKQWLRAKTRDDNERRRLWNRARTKRPDLITKPYSGRDRRKQRKKK